MDMLKFYDIRRNVLKRVYPKNKVMRDWLKQIGFRKLLRAKMSEEDIQAVESGAASKTDVVAKYAEKSPEAAKKAQDELSGYLERCPEALKGRDMDELMSDVLFNFFAYGFQPDEYFCFHIGEMQSSEEKRKYLSNRDKDVFARSMNDVFDIGIFYNKYSAYCRLKKYYKRDAICLYGTRDFASFKEFIGKHPVFVKKRVDLYCGQSVELVDISKLDASPEAWFKKTVGQGRHILEERVIQSNVMASLNPSSVNTMRVFTFKTTDGLVIGPCILRVGQTGAFVDNGGSGGILVGIDSKTGHAETDGRDELLHVYEEHPGTHTVFRGFQVPDWDELLSLTKEVSMQLPTLGYIAWDFAHTDNGWLIIEGNGAGQLMLAQIVYQRGMKEDILKYVDTSLL